MPISDKFKMAIKTAEIPIYEIAHRAGIHPVALYKISCGHDRPESGDRRVLAVAQVLGLKGEDCFEEHEQDKTA